MPHLSVRRFKSPFYFSCVALIAGWTGSTGTAWADDPPQDKVGQPRKDAGVPAADTGTVPKGAEDTLKNNPVTPPNVTGGPSAVKPPAAETGGEPDDVGRLSEADKIQVKGFRFTGNTVFSSDELAATIKSYSNRQISAEDLEAARRIVTQFYVERGYINSGATLKDQTVKDGLITFTITEGRLSDLQITGNRYYRRNFIKSQIAPHANEPLNVFSIRDRLQLLRQNSNIKSLNADVRPGSLPGQASLAVVVAENRPTEARIDFDNNRPPSVGAERFSLSLSHQNLTGQDDSLDLRLGLTRDDLKLSNPFNPRDFLISYRSPEFGPKTRVLANYSKSDTTVIEAPFTDLDISSRSENYSIGLQQPLKTTLNENLGVSLSLEHRRSSSFLFGEPFSFSEGDVNGVSQTTALRLSTDYLKRDVSNVLATRLLISYDDNFSGSTDNDDSPNGHFLVALGQAQFVRALDEKGRRIVLRVDAQWANNPLLLVEKFVIGGAQSVRGYRENQLVRDRGFAASAEYRYPLLYNKEGRERLILAPFFDMGGGKNVDNKNSVERDFISSLGTGLIYAGSDRLSAQVYYGYALQDTNTSGHNLQDKGIHFAFSYRM